VKILHKTTRSSKILHQTTLKLQFSLTTSPTPIFLRKMTLPTKIPLKTTKSAQKLAPNNKFFDSETTCADYTQETQLLPRTQPNLAILPPNSPETGSSHTETPQTRLPSGPLQHISKAVSHILTPKTAKLPQIPTSMDSNPQPATSTHFSATQ
jgi:hypothetical protein